MKEVAAFVGGCLTKEEYEEEDAAACTGSISWRQQREAFLEAVAHCFIRSL
ncbi:hypothetical protein ACFQI7_10570 [Paenibacillus allorhizosphaerae]|uniref:Uncharacterized protein n=1 Tax=Paenibacillus allorhizosphaerae TaxID=2849866 RepID=A0ABM8VHX3_9BACL|nr:hypothetical protein [Paenibacillus allorhizosphaerae]CAG7643215.1 hypothetical protein PAECIP111802_02972 [Paenibacillus allorhizosphaerae]